MIEHGVDPVDRERHAGKREAHVVVADGPQAVDFCLGNTKNARLAHWGRGGEVDIRRDGERSPVSRELTSGALLDDDAEHRLGGLGRHLDLSELLLGRNDRNSHPLLRLDAIEPSLECTLAVGCLKRLVVNRLSIFDGYGNQVAAVKKNAIRPLAL